MQGRWGKGKRYLKCYPTFVELKTLHPNFPYAASTACGHGLLRFLLLDRSMAFQAETSTAISSEKPV